MIEPKRSTPSESEAPPTVVEELTISIAFSFSISTSEVGPCDWE
jgi:hypothetical protein